MLLSRSSKLRSPFFPLFPFHSVLSLSPAGYFIGCLLSPHFLSSFYPVSFPCFLSSLLLSCLITFPLPIPLLIFSLPLSFSILSSPCFLSYHFFSFPVLIFCIPSSPLLALFPGFLSFYFPYSPCFVFCPLLSFFLLLFSTYFVPSCFLVSLLSFRPRFLSSLQFVPFRDYIDRRGNHILSMARLAKEVLAEIPDQFLSYMRTRGIKPGPLPPPYTPCPPPAIHPLLTRRVSRI